MKLLNKEQIEEAAWDWTQIGAIVTYTKAPISGVMTNVVMHNSITGECLPMMWDYTELAFGCEQ
jgi:hypothetical protein